MLLIIIILVVLLFAGGGGYYGYSRWGTGGGLGVVGTVLVILLILYLLGALRFGKIQSSSADACAPRAGWQDEPSRVWPKCQRAVASCIGARTFWCGILSRQQLFDSLN